MSGFVYIWFDKAKAMYYVGSHYGTEYDGYVSSSARMMIEYRARPKDFSRRVIERVKGSRADVRDAERRWLSLIRPTELGVRYYNLKRRAQGGNTFEGMSDAQLKEIGEKIRLKRTGSTQSAETRSKQSAAALGVRKSAKACANMSEAAKASSTRPERLAQIITASKLGGIASGNASRGKSKLYATRSGTTGKMFITNGARNTVVEKDAVVPVGWRLGQTRRAPLPEGAA